MAIRNKGNKFQVDVSVKGVRAPRVSCDTLAEAQAVEAQFKAHLLAGGDPAELAQGKTPTGTKGPTLGDLLEATYKDHWQGRKAEASSLRNGTVWADELGYDFPVAELGPQHVREVCDRLAVKGNGPGTINRKLAALSKMLNVGQDQGWCRRFKLPKKKEYTGRLRYFTDEEMDSLIEFSRSDPQMCKLITLAVETGMRQSELLGLTPRDIDLKHGLIVLQVTKGDKRRSVPLTDRAKGICKSLVEGLMAHEKVFDSRLTCRNISRFMKLWKHKRGLPQDDEACFHTLRHTTASRLVQDGVPLAVIQNWMGHSVIETTMKYAHLAPDSLDLALAALNRRNAA
jgi:integrase